MIWKINWAITNTHDLSGCGLQSKRHCDLVIGCKIPRDTHYFKTQEMADHSKLLNIKTYADLTLRCQDTPNFFRDLINANLLKLGKCPKCRRERTLTRNNHYKDNYASRCPKCRKFVPLQKNSFFVQSRFTLYSIMQMLFCWANEISQHQCQNLTGLSRYLWTSIITVS